MGKKRRGAAVERVLELPAGALTSGVRMEITDDRRVVLEGCRRILKYEEDCICVATDTATLRFLGRELRVNRFTAAGTVISGRLLAIEYV